MINYKTKAEIELMRESALLVSKTLAMLAEDLKPGVTTLELDKKAHDFIKDHKARPGFLGQYGYKFTLCTSVNEQVIHGIPNKTELKDGDIISIDCGVIKNNFHGDHAYTFAIGEITDDKKQLMKVTKECLYKGIAEMKALNRVGDISYAIQEHAEKFGYGVVRDLTGHGLGRKLHEPPNVPNFGRKRRGDLLKSGLVLAIEPMINMGSWEIELQKDEWTYVTKDGKPSAHYEHDVAIIDGKPDILSNFSIIEEILRKKGDIYV